MNTLDLGFLFIPIAIATALFSFLRYKYPNGTLKPLSYSFILGVISAFGALFVLYLAGLLGLDQPKSLKRITFLSFVVLGGSQEFFKFLVLRFYALPLKIFRGTADGMVYGISISMGMTLIMMIAYILNPLFRDYEFYRPMLATLAIANTFTAIIMGFFVGMGKARNNRIIDSLTGLAAAAFLHGLYKFCLFTHEYFLAVLAGIVTLGIITFFVSLTLRQQEV